MRCLQSGQDKAEKHGANHDGENHRGRLDRILQDFAHIAEFYGTVNKERNDEAVERADGSGFGRREETGVDAARQMAEPFAAELKEAIADFAFEQNLTHEDVQRHGDEHEVVEGLIGDDRNLRKRGRTAEEKEHAEHTAR